jgi:hypothetical protein
MVAPPRHDSSQASVTTWCEKSSLVSAWPKTHIGIREDQGVLSIIPVLDEFELATELANDWSVRARREVNRWHELS